MRFISAFLTTCGLVAFSACSNDSVQTSSPSSGGQPIEAVVVPSLATQIATLEASGKLPKLDRSSDVRGPDANNNGIRDDIDAWIAAQPITDLQKKAAQQIAKVQQATTLVDLNDKAALQTLGDRTAAATKERAMQYIKYNRASSGSTTSLPSGNTCEP
jgi:hypothetical protein